MELGKFFEQEIKEFLDEKIKNKINTTNTIREEEIEIFNIERDYAKETKLCLQSDDIKGSKKIFDELRKLYNNLKEDDVERVKVFSILEEVYSSIAKYFFEKNKEGTKSTELIELGKEIEEAKKIMTHRVNKNDSEQNKNKIDSKKVEELENNIDKIKIEDLNKEISKNNESKTIDSNQEKDKKEVKPTSELKKAKDKETEEFEEIVLKDSLKREELDESLEKIILKTKDLIKEKKLEESVKLYREAKKIFLGYPSFDKFRKIDWYNSLILLYNEIKDLHNEIKKKTIKQKNHLKKIKEINEKKFYQKKKELTHLVQLKKLSKEIIALIDQNNAYQAEKKLINLKRGIALLNEEYSEEKKIFETVMSKLIYKIQLIKMNERNNFETKQKKTENDLENKKIEEELKEIEKLYQKGVLLQRTGNHSKAKKIFGEIIEKAPEHLPTKIRLEQINRQKLTEV